MRISNQDWKRNSAVVAKEAEESFDALNTLTKAEIKWSIGAGLIGDSFSGLSLKHCGRVGG